MALTQSVSLLSNPVETHSPHFCNISVGMGNSGMILQTGHFRSFSSEASRQLLWKECPHPNIEVLVVLLNEFLHIGQLLSLLSVSISSSLGASMILSLEPGLISLILSFPP